MSKQPKDYTIFKKTVSKDKTVYCVYFRDENGDRINPIYISKLKKLLYKGKKKYEPIEDLQECIKIVEKSLNNEITRHFIFDRNKPSSPNFIEFVRMIGDYDNSPYIKRRLKEGNPILRHTVQGNLNSFNKHIVPLIPPTLTLRDIDDSNGRVLTEIRDKVIDLDISPTIKNKGFQCMRDSLKYGSERSLIKHNYKDRLKNSKIIGIEGKDPLNVEEINNVLSYYNRTTKRGTWERYKYLITFLSSTTGMRPGEIMGLKKQDIITIDTENDCGVLLVNHSIDSDKEYSKRKNKKKVFLSTYIPLIEEILEFSNSNPKKSDWCFWDRNHPENHLTPDQFFNIPNSSFNSIGLKEGDRKLSFYSLRKTPSTIIGNNQSYKHHKSSSLLGHSNVFVTEQHYITNTIEGSIDNFNDIRQYIKIPS